MLMGVVGETGCEFTAAVIQDLGFLFLLLLFQELKLGRQPCRSSKTKKPSSLLFPSLQGSEDEIFLFFFWCGRDLGIY